MTKSALGMTKKAKPKSPFLHARFSGLSCRMTHAIHIRTSPAAAGRASAPISPAGRTGDRPRRTGCPRAHRPDAFSRKLTLSAAQPDTFRRRLTHPPARRDAFPARLTLLPARPDTSGRRLTLSPRRLTLLACKLTHFGRFRLGPCLVCQHPVLGDGA